MPDNTCKCCGHVIAEGETLCIACSDYDDMQTFRPRIITNGDKIQNMKPIELARFIEVLLDTCTKQECDRCPIGRIGGICNMHTITAWLIREADG